MSQTSVAEQALGFPGMKADSGNDDVISRIAEGALVDGTLAVVGTSVDTEAKAPTAGADVTTLTSLRGVVLHSHARESGAAANPSYADGDMVSLMRSGRVLVKVEEAVTPASPVFVRHAAGAGGTVLGAFRASADTATASQLPVSAAKYVSSAAPGGLAVLELSIS